MKQRVPHKIALSILLVTAGIALGFLKYDVHTAHASDTDFSNGITVDSTADGDDASIGNGICATAGGECTLRAAIQEANSNPDLSTIKFNITGTASFTNNTHSGYTIKPQTGLPDITEKLVIDGYTQPSAQANTNPAPQPFNGTLLIEIDGSEVGTGASGLIVRSNQSELHGLVINNFDGPAVLMQADDVVVRGNYLGTDPEGAIAKPNVTGVNTFMGPDRAANAVIGGVNAQDRNIISGNTAGGGAASGGYPGTGWIIKGNYIGVGADGLTAIANSSVNGSGGLSIDFADDVVVGGPEATATNVIAGNLSHGLAPDHTNNLLIQNNYIGVGYDGTTSVGNGGAGITVGATDTLQVLDNIIANSAGEGLYFNEVTNATIQANIIRNSVNAGISIGPDTHNVLIGGADSSDANEIYDNGDAGIKSAHVPQLDNDFTAIGNTIHDNGSLGIELSYGGTANDTLDTDTGSNDLLNFPVYRTVKESGAIPILNTKLMYLPETTELSIIQTLQLILRGLVKVRRT